MLKTVPESPNTAPDCLKDVLVQATWQLNLALAIALDADSIFGDVPQEILSSHTRPTIRKVHRLLGMALGVEHPQASSQEMGANHG